MLDHGRLSAKTVQLLALENNQLLINRPPTFWYSRPCYTYRAACLYGFCGAVPDWKTTWLLEEYTIF